jgi:hypothetical protein
MTRGRDFKALRKHSTNASTCFAIACLNIGLFQAESSLALVLVLSYATCNVDSASVFLVSGPIKRVSLLSEMANIVNPQGAIKDESC